MTGPVFAPGQTMGRLPRLIGVPSHFFKLVVAVGEDRVAAAAFLVPNEAVPLEVSCLRASPPPHRPVVLRVAWTPSWCGWITWRPSVGRGSCPMAYPNRPQWASACWESSARRTASCWTARS